MKTRVLIVDDSALARRNLRQILESADCEVAEAEDGLSALERYFLDKPDVVLLDLVMRGMYGLDVLEKLRQLDPAAKVVVVSADIQTSSQQLVDQAGAKAFITKPFDREEILGRSRRCPGRSTLVDLTAVQQDALVELINIGFGRAAAALSKLTGHRVQLEVPEITMCSDRADGHRTCVRWCRARWPAFIRFSRVRSRATRCSCSTSRAPRSSRSC